MAARFGVTRDAVEITAVAAGVGVCSSQVYVAEPLVSVVVSPTVAFASAVSRERVKSPCAVTLRASRVGCAV